MHCRLEETQRGQEGWSDVWNTFLKRSKSVSKEPAVWKGDGWGNMSEICPIASGTKRVNRGQLLAVYFHTLSRGHEVNLVWRFRWRKGDDCLQNVLFFITGCVCAWSLSTSLWRFDRFNTIALIYSFVFQNNIISISW